MEQEAAQTKSEAKANKKLRPVFLKKIDAETARLVGQLKERANKKPFGRKIRDSELIQLGIKLIQPEHLVALQESTYSEQDRLHIAHEDFIKNHGKISLDHFIGKLIRGEIKVS